MTEFDVFLKVNGTLNVLVEANDADEAQNVVTEMDRNELLDKIMDQLYEVDFDVDCVEVA